MSKFMKNNDYVIVVKRGPTWHLVNADRSTVCKTWVILSDDWLAIMSAQWWFNNSCLECYRFYNKMYKEVIQHK